MIIESISEEAKQLLRAFGVVVDEKHRIFECHIHFIPGKPVTVEILQLVDTETIKSLEPTTYTLHDDSEK